MSTTLTLVNAFYSNEKPVVAIETSSIPVYRISIFSSKVFIRIKENR